jgi:hypothetical protein
MIPFLLPITVYCIVAYSWRLGADCIKPGTTKTRSAGSLPHRPEACLADESLCSMPDPLAQIFL